MKSHCVTAAVLEVAGARRAVPMGCAGVTTSVPQMPQASTVTRTSLGPGSGRSRDVRCSSAPGRSTWMVEILALVDSLGEGAAVPSERELAARLGMARETVRQALRELLVEGRIRRCHGRATVVAGPKIVQPLSIESYTEGVRKQGREPGRTLVGLDTNRRMRRSPATLETEPDASVLHLERILLSDGEPMGLESTYLPAERFPRLHVEFDRGTSQYAYIRGTGVTFHAASEHIETVLASPREAALLGTNPALPMGGGSPRLRRGSRATYR